MRPVATCGVLLLLLLFIAAFVVARRSPDADPSPASMPGHSSPQSARGSPQSARGSPQSAHGQHVSPVTASRPLAHTGPPVAASGLVVCCGYVDFGDLDPEDSVHVEIPWHRVGAGVLAVREVRTGCGCVRATGLPETIARDAQGTLALDVRVPSRPGPFSLAVQVLTDRPPDDVARIDLCGFSGHDVYLDTTVIDFQVVPRGKEVERVVSVRFPAALPDAAIRARLHGVEGVVSVHVPLQPNWPLQRNWPLQPNRREGGWSERGADLLVRVLSDVPGPIEGVLEVVVGDREPHRLPVRGSIADH